MYTKSGAENINLDTDEGLHYIYYDGDTLSQSTTWSMDFILKYALVAIIYWDATNTQQIYLGSEYKHTAKMGSKTHQYLHETRGFALETGGGLTDITVNQAGNTLSDAQFGCEATIAYDEDAEFTFNDPDRKFGVIQGENQYNTKNKARDGAEVEISSIILDGIPTAEIKFLGTIIYQTSDAYGGTNTTKSRTVSTNSGDDYIDLRDEGIFRGGISGTITDHGALSGLGDDDHIQYLLADGTRALAGAWDMGSQATTNVNIDSGVITGITDLLVEDGGTGRSSHTAYAVICGGTTTTAAQQSIAGVGTAGQVLTSTGASSLPTFQSAGAAAGDIITQVYLGMGS